MNEYSTAHLKTTYRSEGSIQLSILVLTLLLTLLVSCFAMIGLYYRIPKPKYFAISAENRFFEMPALNEPSLSQGLLQNWVANFAAASHTFDFYHFDNQAKNMKKYFTPEGYQEYLANIASFRSDVMAKQIMLSCIVAEAPSIRRSTVLENIYEWYVEVPILIRYDSASTVKNEQRTLMLVIRRQNNPDNPYGVVVSTFRSR